MMYAHGVNDDEQDHSGLPCLKSSMTSMMPNQNLSTRAEGCCSVQLDEADSRDKHRRHTRPLSKFSWIVKSSNAKEAFHVEKNVGALDRLQDADRERVANPENLSRNSSLSEQLSFAGWVCFSLGQNEEALRYSMEAVQVYNGPDGSLVATLWCNVGFLLYLLNSRIDDAISALTKSFQILSNIRSSEDQEQRDMTTVQALLLLTHARREGIRDRDPIQLLVYLIEQREQTGCDHPAAVPILRTLGIFYMVRELYKPATTFFKEAYRVLRKTNSDDKEQMISLMYLGQCYQVAGRHSDALLCYEKALNVKPSSLWGESLELQSIASTLFYNIGMIHSSECRYRSHASNDEAHQRENALQSFHACLKLRKSCYGVDHHSLGNVLHNIAILVMEEGDVCSSLVYFEESLRVWSKEQALYQGGVASSLRYMAYVYKEQGDFRRALDYFTEALETLHQKQTNCTELLIEVLVGLGLTQRMLGLIDQATKSYEEAAQLLRERTQLGNGETVHHMVRLLIAMGNLAMDLSETEAAHAFFYEAANLDPNNEEGQPKSCRRIVEMSPKQFPRHSAAA